MFKIPSSTTQAKRNLWPAFPLFALPLLSVPTWRLAGGLTSIDSIPSTRTPAHRLSRHARAARPFAGSLVIFGLVHAQREGKAAAAQRRWTKTYSQRRQPALQDMYENTLVRRHLHIRGQVWYDSRQVETPDMPLHRNHAFAGSSMSKYYLVGSPLPAGHLSMCQSGSAHAITQLASYVQAVGLSTSAVVPPPPAGRAVRWMQPRPSCLLGRPSHSRCVVRLRESAYLCSLPCLDPARIRCIK